MGRPKKEPEPDADPAPKGESLPPMEDFVRKMSTRIPSEPLIDNAATNSTEEGDEGPQEENEDEGEEE